MFILKMAEGETRAVGFKNQLTDAMESLLHGFGKKCAQARLRGGAEGFHVSGRLSDDGGGA